MRILPHSSDSDEKMNILEAFFRRSFYTLQDLWEYRKYFLELTEEQLKDHPILVCGLIQILPIEGDLEHPQKRLEMLPADSSHYMLLKSVHLTVTAGRPSVLNGLWDMTPVTEELTKDKEVAMQRLSPFLGEQAQFVYELMCAEKFRYDRLLADEGQRMLELLKNYCKERGGKGNGQETL